jgi:hypothetical protein
LAATLCTVSDHNLTNPKLDEEAALYVVSVADIVFQSEAIVILVPAINLSCFQFHVVLFAAVTNLLVEVESSTKSASSLLAFVISVCKPETKSATLNSTVLPFSKVRIIFLFTLS